MAESSVRQHQCSSMHFKQPFRLDCWNFEHSGPIRYPIFFRANTGRLAGGWIRLVFIFGKNFQPVSNLNFVHCIIFWNFIEECHELKESSKLYITSIHTCVQMECFERIQRAPSCVRTKSIVEDWLHTLRSRPEAFNAHFHSSNNTRLFPLEFPSPAASSRHPLRWTHTLIASQTIAINNKIIDINGVCLPDRP